MASIIPIGDKWRAQVRRKGFPKYTRTFSTKAQAQAWARGLEADMDRGSLPKAAAVAGQRYTVATMVDDYRKLRDASRPISDTSNEHYMLRTLAAHLGDLDASTLSTDDLLAFAQARQDAGAGPYTINMDISKLGTVMRMVASAKKMNLPDVVQKARPLLTHLKLIGGGGRRERRPTDDELTRILEHMADTYGQVWADAVQFAVGTTMRRGEITRLRWADLDRKKRLVLIRDRKDPREKQGNDQWVPLLGGMFELVERQPRRDDEPRIWPIGDSTLSKYFTWTCQALSIPDLHFHDLRHHGISLLFEQGYRIEQVALVSGHKSWQHLKRYTQLRPEDLHRGPLG